MSSGARFTKLTDVEKARLRDWSQAENERRETANSLQANIQAIAAAGNPASSESSLRFQYLNFLADSATFAAGLGANAPERTIKDCIKPIFHAYSLLLHDLVERGWGDMLEDQLKIACQTIALVDDLPSQTRSLFEAVGLGDSFSKTLDLAHIAFSGLAGVDAVAQLHDSSSQVSGTAMPDSSTVGEAGAADVTSSPSVASPEQEAGK